MTSNIIEEQNKVEKKEAMKYNSELDHFELLCV